MGGIPGVEPAPAASGVQADVISRQYLCGRVKHGCELISGTCNPLSVICKEKQRSQADAAESGLLTQCQSEQGSLGGGDSGMGDDLFAEMAQGLILGPQAGTPASDPFRLPQAYPPQVPPCSINPVKGPMVVSLPDNVVPGHIAVLFSSRGMRSQPLLHGMVHSGKGALPACCIDSGRLHCLPLIPSKADQCSGKCYPCIDSYGVP